MTKAVDMDRPRVRFYTRAGCQLCEQAVDVVMRVRRRVPFPLQQVDITTDPELLRRYRYRIPVVEIDGEEVFELTVREDRLLALLRGR